MRLLVASEDGYLYIYNLDSNEGGDLTLSKQHRLDGRTDVAAAASASATATATASTGTGQVDGTASAAVATGQTTTGRTDPKPVKSQDPGMNLHIIGDCCRYRFVVANVLLLLIHGLWVCKQISYLSVHVFCTKLYYSMRNSNKGLIKFYSKFISS